MVPKGTSTWTSTNFEFHYLVNPYGSKVNKVAEIEECTFHYFVNPYGSKVFCVSNETTFKFHYIVNPYGSKVSNLYFNSIFSTLLNTALSAFPDYF